MTYRIEILKNDESTRQNWTIETEVEVNVGDTIGAGTMKSLAGGVDMGPDVTCGVYKVVDREFDRYIKTLVLERVEDPPHKGMLRHARIVIDFLGWRFLICMIIWAIDFSFEKRSKAGVRDAINGGLEVWMSTTIIDDTDSTGFFVCSFPEFDSLDAQKEFINFKRGLISIGVDTTKDYISPPTNFPLIWKEQGIK